jgi:uncharacterized membrane protein (UPF0127 family)
MVQGALVVRNVTRDKVLATQAAEARSFGARFMGLMGQTALPIGHGLHIVPCTSIHTFFMRIPIDALFLDRSGKVVKILGAMAPWRMSAVYFDARSVLELPAGVAAASGTAEGDQLEFTNRSPSP